MSYPPTQGIQMVNVFCNLIPHQGELIRTLCLYPECQESSALCSKCLIKSHLQCRNEVLEVEVIPKQLMELQQLQQAIGHLQIAINKQFKELLSTIEQLLMPISKYQDSPNLTNLNGVGSLLRKLPKQCIQKSIGDMKYKIKHILENHDFQVEKDKEEVILLKVDELYQQGMIYLSYYQGQHYIIMINMMKQQNTLKKQQQQIQIINLQPTYQNMQSPKLYERMMKLQNKQKELKYWILYRVNPYNIFKIMIKSKIQANIYIKSLKQYCVVQPEQQQQIYLFIFIKENIFNKQKKPSFEMTLLLLNKQIIIFQLTYISNKSIQSIYLINLSKSELQFTFTLVQHMHINSQPYNQYF